VRKKQQGLTVDDVRSGVPGLGEIHPGTHVCALYSGPEERDRLLAPFLQEGLRHGDQCVCLVDDLEPASMTERVIAMIAGFQASGTENELPLLRAAAEMFCLREPGAEELLVYECTVNDLLAVQPGLFLCMYDLQRFRVGTLVDVLRTHSKVLVDGTVLDNPHWVTPERSLTVPARQQ
jgi:MEDS: MEthanogen/methylotroph, DcmR Sensory domain